MVRISIGRTKSDVNSYFTRIPLKSDVAMPDIR